MFSFFNTQPLRTLPSFGHYCFPMHTNLFKILCFSCQGKSRDIVYQRICLFLWLRFAQHGSFEIQLTVYSALLRLTDLYLGIYECGIWLLIIFHIPYIHFQRELRKVTSPKWYLPFFCSVYKFWYISIDTNRWRGYDRASTSQWPVLFESRHCCFLLPLCQIFTLHLLIFITNVLNAMFTHFHENVSR